MALRDSLATAMVDYSIAMAEKLGCKRAVEISGNELEISMEVPDTSKRGWDFDMYSNGGLFIDGYANPVKPFVVETPNPKTPDELRLEAIDEADEDDVKYDIVPSYRYQKHQDQHVMSELLNPTEQWKLLVYGIIGLGALIFFNIIIVLYATGSFA